MIRTPVQSSNIASIGHAGQTLEVEFKNGAVWQYASVSPAEFEQLKNAPSVGKHFNAHIKNRCVATQIQKAA